MNHPNRKKATRGIPPASPTPDQVRDLRNAAGLTQRESAGLVHCTITAWQRWEAPDGTPFARAMPSAAWELFIIKLRLMGVETPTYLENHLAALFRGGVPGVDEN